MKKKHFLYTLANFSTFMVLAAIVAAPLYFASKFTQVAGVKSQSTYLIISQAEKFPGMKFSQDGTTYSLNLPNSAEAYLAVLILNNPTNQSRTYQIESSDGFFFGDNLDEKLKSISLPAGASVPVSVQSKDNSEVEFSVK
ncbi:hypothetical protein HY382_01495 [Candidatus Curtissbacteria bacterium]|nr:hypothetical protein [Candidatus Curtissbacteria bacterium]